MIALSYACVSYLSSNNMMGMNKMYIVCLSLLTVTSHTKNLIIFQQPDFTNGKAASVFLQLHIWLSMSLRKAVQVTEAKEPL